jgi:hypothetical protein
MSHELICSWLGLPPESWPPDHYALLGLSLGEGDVEKIEEHVHERLMKVRRYQLSHPDQATEAMNRLAQAFTCLTDPEAKRAYDAALLSPQPVAVEEPPPVISVDEPDPLAWLFGPWNQLTTLPEPFPDPTKDFPAPSLRVQDWAKAPPPPRVSVRTAAPAVPADNGAPAITAAPAQDQVAEPADRWVETARESRPARRGLGTKRALYQRLVSTRSLLWHWQQVGKFLGYPERRLTRIAEAKELTRHLAAILELLPSFPPLLGRADQPGYLVIVMARWQLIIPTFRGLKHEQREALARHWRDGFELLKAHRRFLREELKAMRQTGLIGQALRAVRAVITDQPEAILLVLALLALGVAVCAQFTR